MEVKEIIEKLKYNKDRTFQKEAILEARKKKEEVTEVLLKELDKVANNIEKYAEEQDYFLPLYAMYLLAEFREKRAFPIIIKLITSEQNAVDHLLGDVITEDLKSILASTFDGNVNSLYEVITNLKLNEYVRGVAFQTLEILNKYKIITKEEIIEIIDKMMADELKDDDSIVMSDIVTFISANQIYDKIELVKNLYNENRIDIQMIGDYDQFIDDIYGKIDYHENKNMIEDTIKSLSWWACFKNKDKEDNDNMKTFSNNLKEFIKKEMKKEEYEVKKTKEIGRNDLCSCGSGKKYKKCCMNKKEISIITPADMYIEKSLKDYPKEELLKYYDEESVQIDEKLYQVLKHKAIPLWVDRNYTEENRRNIKNMNEAIELIKIKCKKEKIDTIQEFDKKIAIHYSFNDILNKYFGVIDKNKRAFFEDKQKQKVDFMIQISQIINMSTAYKKFYIANILEEYFYDDITEDAEDVIHKLKEQFPDMRKYLEIELSKVYQAEGYEIEKILEPVEQYIKEFGNDEELDIRKIELYYEYALSSYYQEEQKELEIYQKLWLLVKDYINANKIETEDEFNKKQESEYCFNNFLYRIDRFYEDDQKYIDQRVKILKEASKIMKLNEDSKEIIASGLAESYNNMNKKTEAIQLIDKFIKDFPNNTNAIITKANIYSNMENPQYEKAIDILKQALTANNEYDKHLLYSKIALLYDECGMKDKANEYQKLAIE